MPKEKGLTKAQVQIMLANRIQDVFGELSSFEECEESKSGVCGSETASEGPPVPPQSTTDSSTTPLLSQTSGLGTARRVIEVSQPPTPLSEAQLAHSTPHSEPQLPPDTITINLEGTDVTVTEVDEFTVAGRDPNDAARLSYIFQLYTHVAYQKAPLDLVPPDGTKSQNLGAWLMDYARSLDNSKTCNVELHNWRQSVMHS